MKISKIMIDKPKDKIEADLRKYAQLCISEGASDAKAINREEVFIDYRAQMKCYFPKCFYFNTNAHCPPHTMAVDDVKKFVFEYTWAVIFILRIPAEKMLLKTDQKEKIADRRKIARIISTVEGRAYGEGYYFATGFGAGCCKMTWCPDSPCSILEGKACPFPLKSRPSMEALGFDVFKMVAKVGWDIYPIGAETAPHDVPHALRAGLVLIH